MAPKVRESRESAMYPTNPEHRVCKQDKFKLENVLISTSLSHQPLPKRVTMAEQIAGVVDLDDLDAQFSGIVDLDAGFVSGGKQGRDSFCNKPDDALDNR